MAALCAFLCLRKVFATFGDPEHQRSERFEHKEHYTFQLGSLVWRGSFVRKRTTQRNHLAFCWNIHHRDLRHRSERTALTGPYADQINPKTWPWHLFTRENRNREWMSLLVLAQKRCISTPKNCIRLTFDKVWWSSKNSLRRSRLSRLIGAIHHICYITQSRVSSSASDDTLSSLATWAAPLAQFHFIVVSFFATIPINRSTKDSQQFAPAVV